MESHRELKEEQIRIKQEHVTIRQFDAIIPHLQQTLNEVRGDIKKLLVIVHNASGSKKSPDEA